MKRIASGAMLLALVFVGLMVITTAGQTRRQEERSLILKSTFGQDLYQFYCSNCHGMDGKGRKPRTELKTPPPDLTRLSRRNGGAFPRERVRSTIAAGATVPGSPHGTSEMPIWGWIFRGLEPSDTQVQIRIANLVEYIESIQEP